MNLWDFSVGFQDADFSFLIAMGAPAQGSNPLLGLLPMVAILAIFYFIILRPMKARQQKVQAFIEALKVGDRVVTSGGIYGKIIKLGEQSLQLEIAERVRVEVSRNAVVGYQGQEPVAAPEDAAR
jgi:preprotein translocase subunit YajC